jgi:hypothetical protein
MDSIFCNAKPGDIVYDIPQPPMLRIPEKFFLKLNSKRQVIAINAADKEIDFNPEKFCETLERARITAEQLWWKWLSQNNKIAFLAIQCHQSGKYPELKPMQQTEQSEVVKCKE